MSIETSACGLNRALAVVGGKWKPFLLYHFQHGPRRFGDPAAPERPSYGIIGFRVWRFVDFGRRLKLSAGQAGMVPDAGGPRSAILGDGRLATLRIDGETALNTPTVYAAHLRDRSLGRAGR